MNEKELTGKIHSSMYHQLQSRGYAAPVDVLIDTGILPKQKYEDWRFGRVRYLEAVCNANLKRLSFVLHQMRVYAQAHGLKPSFCYYKRGLSHIKPDGKALHSAMTTQTRQRKTRFRTVECSFSLAKLRKIMQTCLRPTLLLSQIGH